MSNQKKYDVKYAEIDDHILKLASEGNILLGLTDQKQINRVIFNCFAEFLAEMQEMRKSTKALADTLSVCGYDKMNKFFNKVEENYKAEVAGGQQSVTAPNVMRMPPQRTGAINRK